MILSIKPSSSQIASFVVLPKVQANLTIKISFNQVASAAFLLIVSLRYLFITFIIKSQSTKELVMNNSAEFNVGDLVVVVTTQLEPYITKVVQGSSNYPVAVTLPDGEALTLLKSGMETHYRALATIFHATPENIAAVNQLYGCDLKLPMTPNEIIKAMLDRGDKFVVARVSDKSFDDARVNLIEPIIVERVNSAAYHPVRTFKDVGWMFAIPIDPRTGLEITESDLEAQS